MESGLNRSNAYEQQWFELLYAPNKREEHRDYSEKIHEHH